MNYKTRKARLLSFAAALVLGFCGNAYAFPVDFSDTPVPEALKALGIRAGKDVVVASDIRTKITMHMDDTDFDTALKAIATVYNLSYRYQDDLVVVGSQKVLNNMKMFELKHLDPDMFKKQLEPILEDSDDAVVNTDLHSISVMGSSSTLERVEELVKKYDVAQKQVNIQATVIELSKGKARSMGLNYADSGWGRDTRISIRNDNSAGFSFSITADHEETLSGGKVLARPNVTTFNGRKAKIIMGDQVPVFTSTGSGTDANASVNVEYKDVGVNLEVTPRINESDKETVTLSIKPSVSTITEWIESGNNKAPQISSRSVETVVRVKAGETILIGGLLKHDEIKNIRSMLPFFSKIPVLGELFKNRSIKKSDTELVIAITPTIIYDKDGRPQVELQKISPKLHNELNGMDDKPMDYNLTSEKQKEYEEQIKLLTSEKEKLEVSKVELEKRYKEVVLALNAADEEKKEFKNLAKRFEDANKKLEDKDIKIKSLEKERDELKKELAANNEVMKQVVEKIQRAGGR